jgi:predicted NBD/HSP70 family sugar kinase
MWAARESDPQARAFIREKAKILDDCFHRVADLLPPPTALRLEMRSLLAAVSS